MSAPDYIECFMTDYGAVKLDREWQLQMFGRDGLERMRKSNPPWSSPEVQRLRHLITPWAKKIWAEGGDVDGFTYPPEATNASV